MPRSPFHEGERRVQALAGEDRMAARNGRFIGDTLPPNTDRMLGVSTLLNIALSDAEGRVWSLVAAGWPGLIRRLNDVTAGIDRSLMAAPDRLWSLLAPEAAIGLVAMDLTSARRYRVNGTVGEVTDGGFSVAVSETCPNCPKYIQLRQPVRGHAYGEVTEGSGTAPDEEVTTLIRRADTFFVASRGADGRHDASHRGGPPGFVRLRGNVLTVPDYIGNSMFMTLGNFAQDPAGGLTFVDFDAGAQLNLTGKVALAFGDPSAHDGTGGRHWTFEIEGWHRSVFRPDPAWALHAYSRFNPASGTGA